MSIVFDRFWVKDLLAIPTAHELSHNIGVANCGYPNSLRVCLMEVAACPLINRAAYSAAAAESTTVDMIVDIYSIGALGTWPSAYLPKYINPPARDLDLLSDRYDASE